MNDPDSDRSSDPETVIGIEEELVLEDIDHGIEGDLVLDGIAVPNILPGELDIFLGVINQPVPLPIENMAYLHLFKPKIFTGEKNTIGVEDFLETLEISFPSLDTIPDEAKRERAKVLALCGHLDGKAKQF